MVAGPDGEAPHEAATGQRNVGYATWSPDGRRIASVSPSGGGALYVTDVDGGHQLPIGPSDVRAYLPVWSPDGTRLAWVEGDRNSEFTGEAVEGVAIVDVASGSVTRLPDTNVGPQVDSLEWSPDGRQILVGGLGGELVVASADGSGGWSRSGDYASWSPDGRWIAVMDQVGDSFGRVVVVSADGKDELEVHTGQAGYEAPVWLP